ncbi:DUF2169 family type VI secretion system accessory protein [Caldimonas thermodepolymerans]|jgi:Uncharacterized low-complexity proteins|uniref:Uncharacterized protein YjbI with pentapeptide repeats n=1 Tax=Caldimonas thermodepolymerans TaxID=215580 RepID=A0AA46HXI6_9BURK|nr:DUF2169 domain-containing protein [Caldimonas thermodepolymerans]TCP09787.1 uncharacterized protein YjbI with pentapeptide repeats [Caldimonas thermodepolymerans]UZG49796.1 DUF2169 domain-containing protein [Caldimonas thermodepolymerans]
MRVLKPACLSVLPRCVEHRGQCYLGISVLAHVPLRGAAHLGAEQALWPMLAAFAPGFVEDGIPRTRSEFLLYGTVHADASQPGSLHVDFGVRMAGITRVGRAFGRRVMEGARLVLQEPLVRAPVAAASAYGGPGYPANPAGTGHPSSVDAHGYLHLPQIELPAHPWVRDPQRNVSALFGALDITHPLRARHAGTYDAGWLKQHFPGLPPDADWALYNKAVPEQQLEAPWRGDEAYDLLNLRADAPRLSHRLPGVTARVLVRRQARPEALEDLRVALRTVLFLPDQDRVVLVWQALCRTARDDASDIDLLIAGAEHLGRPKPLTTYADVVRTRLDEKDGVLAMLDDEPLVPEDMPFDGLMGELPDLNTPPEPDSMLARTVRRAERTMQEARDEVASHGLDPDEHAPPARMPAPPEIPPPARWGAFMRELIADAEQRIAGAKQVQQVRIADAEQVFKAQNLDFQVVMREMSGADTLGPPQALAPATLQTLRDIDALARAQGEPVGEVAEMLADIPLQQRWVQQDRQALDLYRETAHARPAVPRTQGRFAERQRRWVAERLAKGEGLQGLDLSGANLAGINLAGVDCEGAMLEGADLRGATLTGARFARAVLAHADLSDAQLQGCDFTDANLGRARLDRANATGAILVRATLTQAVLNLTVLQRAVLRGAQLYSVILTGADLAGADLEEAQVLQCNLSSSSLQQARVDKAQFVECNLKHTRWSGCSGAETVFMNIACAECDFTGARLPQSRWVGAVDLSGARFDDAQLAQAYFGQGSCLRAASLERVQADGVDFTACNLECAVLRAARLRGASLRRARLVEADLSHADLMGAILQNADAQGAALVGAHLYGADLARLRADTRTRLDGAVLHKARTYPRWQAPAERR